MKTNLLIALLCAAVIAAHAQSTAFTYQGRLAANGSPYTGFAEMQFALFSAPTGGIAVAASTPGIAGVNVSGGLFATSLDFGAAAFPGADRWLEVQVRTNLGAFRTLTPRQPLTQVVTTPPLTGGGFSLAGGFSRPSDLVWTNLAGGDWNVATNWSPNLVPTRNDNAIINLGVTVTVSSPAECFGLTLGGFSTSPTLTGSGTITIYGLSTWVNGTMSGGGRTVVEPGGSLSVANPGGNAAFLNTRTLENGGTLLWTGLGGIVMNFGAVVTNRPGALFHVQNAASFVVNVGGGRIDNAGTFRKSGNSGTTTFGSFASFNNAGTVDIQTGTLSLGGGGTHSGSFDVPGGTALMFSGGTHSAGASSSITGAGQLIVSGGTANLAGLVNVSGSHTFSGGTANFTGHTICTNNTITISGGTANFSGTCLVSPAFVNLSSGALGGTGTVTVNNGMNWTGGDMNSTGGGRTIIQAGVTLTMANAGAILLNTRTLENGGTVLWSGAGNFAMNSSAVITNRPGALFHVQNAIAISANVGSSRIDNAGTFRKSANSGTTTIGNFISFNNSSTVDIQTGTLSLGGGGTHSGSFDVLGGTALMFSGGTHSAGASSSITGAGQLSVSGGTANLAGLVNVSGSHTFSGGTANFTGHTICTNNTITISGGTANFSGAGLVSPAVVDLNNGTLDGTSTVTIVSAMNWTLGTMSGSGRTIVAPGAALTIANPSGGALLNTRTLENGGTVLWTGAGNIAINSGAVITNRPGALFHVQNAASFVVNVGGGRIDNAGTFRKSGNSGTTTFGSFASFNNAGTVDIQTGTLSLGGGGTHSGSFDVLGGTALMFSGGTHSAGASSSITGAGQLSVSGGTANLAGLVNVSGSHTFSGGTANFTGHTICTNNTITISGGTANFSGTGLVSPAVVNLSNGTLDGTSSVTIVSAMNWTLGTMSGSGRTIIPVGATLTIANPSGGALLNTRTLENGGTVLWTGAGNIALNLGAVVTNRPGALFQVQNAASFVVNVGGGRIDNAGTFRKSGNSGTTTFGSFASFNNSGTVDIRSGIFAANGGYISSSSALLNCALGGTTPGTGYGQLQVAGAVTLNGALSVDFTNGFSPALNDSFTVLTAGTRNGTFAEFVYPSNAVTMQMSNTPNSVIVRVTDVTTAIPRPTLLPPELSGSNLKLIWTTVSNLTYRLEFNPNLTPSNWVALPGDVIGVSNTASKLDPLTPSNRFYRVRVLP